MPEKSQPEASQKAHAPRSAWRLLRAWGRDLFISVVLSALVIIFLYQPVKVEGTSMWPGLDDQERIFINKLVYHMGPIERGDVVVFHYPRNPAQSYIKRVIGLPGDTVKIIDGTVFVNGARLKEAYVPRDYGDTRSMDALKISPGCYFVLGDHRSMSNDSRDFGCVPRECIYGKAVFAYWPMDRLGRLN